MQKIYCPICSAVVDAENYKETYISPYNNQEYTRYECPNCDVHWWEPLKIIPEFYESEMFEYCAGFHEAVGLRLLDNHKAFFRYFPLRTGRLLDVGCGDGRFIKHAKEVGFEVWGIDFDKKSVETIKRELGMDTVFAMSLEEFYEYAKDKGLKFDVITFFEVLEHQDKPLEFLQMVKELLKEEGYIAGSVPNREGLLVEADWKLFHWDYPPHHFLRFSKKALENALKIAGFSEVKVFKIFSLTQLIPLIEKKIFGNIDNFKTKLKALAVGSERRAKAYTVEDLEKVSNRKIVVALLKALKLVRNVALAPFVLLYLGRIRENGINLYFQAKKVETP